MRKLTPTRLLIVRSPFFASTAQVWGNRNEPPARPAVQWADPASSAGFHRDNSTTLAAATAYLVAFSKMISPPNILQSTENFPGPF